MIDALSMEGGTMTLWDLRMWIETHVTVNHLLIAYGVLVVALLAAIKYDRWKNGPM